MIIAVSANGRGSSMVGLYKTMRGYLGGNVEAFDFHSAGWGKTCDDSLAVLGYERVEEWQPSPIDPQGYTARVRKVGER